MSSFFIPICNSCTWDSHQCQSYWPYKLHFPFMCLPLLFLEWKYSFNMIDIIHGNLRTRRGNNSTKKMVGCSSDSKTPWWFLENFWFDIFLRTFSCRSTIVYCSYVTINFFFFFVGHIQLSYFGATGTPVLDFWWHLLWVSKPEWVLPYSHCRGECNAHSLRFTSGATHCQPLDGQHCGVSTGFISCLRILLAPLRLEPAIIRLWVVRANHSATRPGHHHQFRDTQHFWTHVFFFHAILTNVSFHIMLREVNWSLEIQQRNQNCNFIIWNEI